MSDGGGAALIEKSLLAFSIEDDRQIVRTAAWDDKLVELNLAGKSRIPAVVEEKCRRAQHRTACGVIAELCHCWVAADSELFLWDYRTDDAEVHTVPADSLIITVGFCPPKPGVFDGSVQLLIVLCTRRSVNLVGLGPPILGGAAPPAAFGVGTWDTLPGTAEVPSSASQRPYPNTGLLSHHWAGQGFDLRQTPVAPMSHLQAGRFQGLQGPAVGHQSVQPSHQMIHGWDPQAGWPVTQGGPRVGMEGVAPGSQWGSWPDRRTPGAAVEAGQRPWASLTPDDLARSMQYGGSSGSALAAAPRDPRQTLLPSPPGLASSAAIPHAKISLLQLEGFAAANDGALFHAVRSTDDGRIFLVSGAPQVFELAYSKTRQWLSAKCRLVRHAMDWKARLRDFLSFSALSTARIRLLECASRDFVFTVDDMGTIRLYKAVEQASVRGSAPTLEALASLSTEEMCQRVHAAKKEHVSRPCTVTHMFPVLGTDEQLRLHVLTQAGERLLFACSATSPLGPPAACSDAVSSAGARSQQHYGFWLMQYFGPSVEGFLGSTVSTRQAASTSMRSGQFGGQVSTGGVDGRLRASGSGQWQFRRGRGSSHASQGSVDFASRPRLQGRMSDATQIAHAQQSDPQPSPLQQLLGIGDALLRPSCLEERCGPCVRSLGGIWVAAHQRPGSSQVTEVSVLARVATGNGALDLSHSLEFTSPVLDIVEERAGSLTALSLASSSRDGGVLGPWAQLQTEKDQFNPIGSRSFALMCEDGVQVLRVSFKAANTMQEPQTEQECYLHLVKLAQPPVVLSAKIEEASQESQVDHSTQKLWTFDDARVPSVEEQKAARPPPLYLGKWYGGFLRFVGHALRPVWQSMLIAPVQDPQYEKVGAADCQEVARRRTMGLCLAISEAQVQKLLGYLRPVITTAQRSLSQSHHGVSEHQKAPTTAHFRSSYYTRTTQQEQDVKLQAMARTQEILGVAQRASEVLSLLAILHAQKNAFRILQSTLLESTARESLLLMPFGSLIATPQSLAPVVKLCMALVAESGLLTPAPELTFNSRQTSDWQGAGSGKSDASRTQSCESWKASTAGLCRDLEEQCPVLFSKVNLDSRVRGRLVNRGSFGLVASAAPATGEVLSRVVQCTSSHAEEERWAIVARAIKEMANEDPEGAAKICVEKVHHLQQVCIGQTDGGRQVNPAAVMERASLVLEALVGALDPRPNSLAKGGITSKTIIESVLVKTVGIDFETRQVLGSASSSSSKVPFTHRVVLLQLLGNPRYDALFEALLDSSAANIECFLVERCKLDRRAAESLWKYYLRNDQPLLAAAVLRQIAEQDSWEKDCSAPTEDGFAERIQYLDRAQKCASLAGSKGQALLEELQNMAAPANRVQNPLLREMTLICNDSRISPRWHNLAQKARSELQRLQPLPALQNMAKEFGLRHIELLGHVVSATPSDEKEAVTVQAFIAMWVQLFFLPSEMPYSPSQLASQLQPQQLGVFPLLFVRPATAFLLHSGADARLQTYGSISAEDFGSRAMSLIETLALASKESSPIWDVRYLAPLLEYCTCLWMRAVSESQGGADVSKADPSRSGTGEPSPYAASAWVVLAVLPRRPFGLAEAAIVELYADIVLNRASWMTDFEALLPADASGCRPRVSQDSMLVHLSRVLLALVQRWTTKVCERRADERAFADFSASWQQVARPLFRRLASSLEDLSETDVLEELNDVEEAAQRLCTTGLELPRPPPPLPPPFAAPEAEDDMSGAAPGAELTAEAEGEADAAFPPTQSRPSH